MQRYVCGFLFSPDAKHVVLIKKNRPAFQEGLYNAIGGKIEPGENSYEAMSREFQEETGVSFPGFVWKRKVLLTSRIEPDKVYDVEVFYTFSDRFKEVETKTDEEVAIVAIEQIESLPTLKNVKWLIPLCLDTDIADGIDVKNIKGN